MLADSIVMSHRSHLGTCLIARCMALWIPLRMPWLAEAGCQVHVYRYHWPLP